MNKPSTLSEEQYLADEIPTIDSDDVGIENSTFTNLSTSTAGSASPTESKIDKKHCTSARKRKKAPYTEALLQSMLNNIRNGTMSIYHINKTYGIPRATLHYRLGDKCQNKGRTGPDTVLTPDEEIMIVEWIQTMERRGFPIVRNAIIDKVAAYLQENPRATRCRNNVPGKTWLECFMRRHPQITVKTPDAITSISARVSEQDIRKWFQAMENFLLENNLTDVLKNPSRILFSYESGFCMNSIPEKAVAKKAAKNVPSVDKKNSKQNMTVLFSFAADGTIIPPNVILPYDHLTEEIAQSFPVDWGLDTSDSGRMNSSNFTMYIKNVLHPSLVRRKVEFPVLYFVDGHKSQTAVVAADACSKLGIALIALYPNATRLLDPADVSIFRPLKTNWGEIVEIWKTDNKPERISLSTFGSLLHKTMQSAFKASTIINAFRGCGLFPFNPDAVDYSKYILCSSLHVGDGSIIPVPATVIKTALKMIGDEKIKLYKCGDQSSFSNEDKVLSFIYNNILAAGQSSRNGVSYNSDNCYEVEGDMDLDLKPSIAEPAIPLKGEIVSELPSNYNSNLKSHKPFRTVKESMSTESTVNKDPIFGYENDENVLGEIKHEPLDIPCETEILNNDISLW